MGRKTGDKARYNKARRKKLERRVSTRALRKELQAKANAGTGDAPAKHTSQSAGGSRL